MVLWHLAQDEPLQDALRQEVLSADVPDDSTSTSSVNKLPLLAACIQEVLRLWPAAPLIVRQALEYVPPWQGIEIPLGAVAIVAPWLLGRSAILWEEAWAFKPSRFLENCNVDRHAFAWIPFGYGLRSCVGSHLALTELQFFVAAFLRRGLHFSL